MGVQGQARHRRTEQPYRHYLTQSRPTEQAEQQDIERNKRRQSDHAALDGDLQHELVGMGLAAANALDPEIIRRCVVGIDVSKATRADAGQPVIGKDARAGAPQGQAIGGCCIDRLRIGREQAAGVVETRAQRRIHGRQPSRQHQQQDQLRDAPADPLRVPQAHMQ